MKLKKGSKEAKAFMAKIRGKKKTAPKKTAAAKKEIKKIGAIKQEEVYINYLNKDKGFKPDMKIFDSYQEAVNWGKKNFEKFDLDMIKYKTISGIKKVATKKKISGDKHQDIKSHNYKISISGIGNEVFKDFIKQAETEIKWQNYWIKKLETYYKKPTEFNQVCFWLKYKAKKVQEIVNELETKYNFNK